MLNDLEQRRRKLLQETRKNYSEKYIPPAIHPRYNGSYNILYSDKKKSQTIKYDTFIVRLLVAFLLFAIYFILKDKDFISKLIDMIQMNLFG
jgi:hypothetical protein